MLKPPRLCAGDRVAAVTLSWGGPAAFPHRYEAGKRQLEDTFNLEVVEMPHTLDAPEQVAANPAARAADLHAALEDHSIQGIISTIGGDDSIRLLPYLDLAHIRANPKVFMGYSDTTVTHFAFRAAGVTSFYGPSILAGFGENAGLFPYMVDSVRRTLFQSGPVGLIAPNDGEWSVEPLDWADPANQNRSRRRKPPVPWRWLQGEGYAEGPLLGGCVEVLEFLRGTPFWPALDDWEGAILFLETSEAVPPDTFARWIRGYAAMGILERLAAILVGRPGGAVPVRDFGEYDRALVDVVTGEHGRRDVAIVTCMDFGHTDPMFVLPLGVHARIECRARTLELTESAVD